MARKIALMVSAAIAVGLVVVLVPFLSREREVLVSTPAAPGLFQSETLTLEPGSELRVQLVTLDPAADAMRLLPRITNGAAPELLIRLSAENYEYETRVSGYRDEQPLVVPIDPPDEARIGEVHIVNQGSAAVAFTATTEPRSAARADPRIDGEPYPGDVAMSFVEREPASLASRLGDVVQHMAAFKPLEPWLLWPLAFAVVLGVPAAAVGALYLGLRDEAQRSGQ